MDLLNFLQKLLPAQGGGASGSQPNGMPLPMMAPPEPRPMSVAEKFVGNPLSLMALGGGGMGPPPPPAPSVPGGQGFASNGLLSMLSKLAGGLPGAAPQPAPAAPAPAPSAVAGPSAPAPVRVGKSGAGSAPSPAQAEPGFDFKNFMRNVAAGAASDPNRSVVGAFATGANRSMESQAARDAAAKKDAEEKEATSFERGLKTNQEKRATAREVRDARTAKINDAKLVAETMRKVNPTIELRDRVDISKALTNFANMAREAYMLEGDKLKEAVEAERKRLEGNLAPAPATDISGGAPSARVAPAAPAVKSAAPAGAAPTSWPKPGERRGDHVYSGRGHPGDPSNWDPVR